MAILTQIGNPTTFLTSFSSLSWIIDSGAADHMTKKILYPLLILHVFSLYYTSRWFYFFSSRYKTC